MIEIASAFLFTFLLGTSFGMALKEKGKDTNV